MGKEILIRVRFVLYLEPLTPDKWLILLFSLSGTSLARFAGVSGCEGMNSLNPDVS